MPTPAEGIQTQLRNIEATYGVSIDELVEVSFTVSPAVRRIAAHEPDKLETWEYLRQLYFSPSLKLPKGDLFREMMQEICVADDSVDAYLDNFRQIPLDPPAITRRTSPGTCRKARNRRSGAFSGTRRPTNST